MESNNINSQQSVAGEMPLGASIAIGVVILFGISVGGYFMYNYFNPPKKKDGDNKPLPASDAPAEAPRQPKKPVTTNTSSAAAPVSSNTATPAPANVVLQSGSTGADVITLQTKLNGKGANLVVDGDFGALTQAALQKYYGQPTITTAQLAGWNNEFGGDYNRVFFVKKLPNSFFGGCAIF